MSFGRRPMIKNGKIPMVTAPSSTITAKAPLVRKPDRAGWQFQDRRRPMAQNKVTTASIAPNRVAATVS